jgi:hypothetical protein
LLSGNPLKSTVRRAHLLRLDLLPAVIGVKRRDALGALLGVFAEVPLMDHSSVADDKGHHARVAIVGRIGNERKAPDHLALDQVVERTAGRVRSLLSENTIVIAVIGPRATAGLVTFCGRLGRELTQRAIVAVGRPIEAILLARAADDALRIDANAVAAILFRILIFSIDEGETGLDSVEFIAPDATVQNLLTPSSVSNSQPVLVWISGIGKTKSSAPIVNKALLPSTWIECPAS